MVYTYLISLLPPSHIVNYRQSVTGAMVNIPVLEKQIRDEDAQLNVGVLTVGHAIADNVYL